jgi:hypothetical protein
MSKVESAWNITALGGITGKIKSTPGPPRSGSWIFFPSYPNSPGPIICLCSAIMPVLHYCSGQWANGNYTKVQVQPSTVPLFNIQFHFFSSLRFTCNRPGALPPGARTCVYAKCCWFNLNQKRKFLLQPRGGLDRVHCLLSTSTRASPNDRFPRRKECSKALVQHQLADFAENFRRKRNERFWKIVSLITISCRKPLKMCTFEKKQVQSSQPLWIGQEAIKEIYLQLFGPKGQKCQNSWALPSSTRTKRWTIVSLIRISGQKSPFFLHLR